MLYFSSQQDTTYFHWQIETYLRNFERVGIPLKNCHVILLYDREPSSRGMMLAKQYEANFHFYQIDPRCKTYIAATKPFGMWRYWQENKPPKKPIFYHDADIIFTHLPDFKPLLSDPITYLSACLQRGGMSYIDLEYLNQFDGVVDGLARIVGTPPRAVGGGAQYIIKNPTTDYWEKVYLDSFKIREFLVSGRTKVQVWCAEMWSTLWNLWLFGHETQTHPLLDFCMSRDPIEELKPIVHNAGLMGASNFNKARYTTKYPPNNLTIDSSFCNYVYYQEVKRISYIRDMGKIKFIKGGASDMNTGHVYQVGEVADLGDERNANAVKGGYAVVHETEKKEGAPKKAAATVRGKKVQTK